MTTRIGINGFGRVGRLTLRSILERYGENLEVVAINGHRDSEIDSHLFKWDSTYGRYPGTVEATGDSIIIDGKPIALLSERVPSRIPWENYGVDIVIESTGEFTDAHKASAHLCGTVKKVIVSAAASNGHATIVMGVNENTYDPELHSIISNASCTTNCVAPVVKVLHENFGLKKALMTTVHAFTNDQRLIDGTHKDLRRARSAVDSMIPTKTGAAKAIGLVIPELDGKIDGMAIRVPTNTVSVVDLVATLERPVTKSEVNKAFAAASRLMPEIMEYCEEELVSVDFKGNPASCIIDAPKTMVIDDTVKVLAWYDNEWGYCCRLADLTAFVAAKERKLAAVTA